MKPGEPFANRWRDSYTRFTKPEDIKPDESLYLINDTHEPPEGMEFLAEIWGLDQRVHISIPFQLGFLRDQLPYTNKSISPRSESTSSGEYPIFMGNDVAIFLDWYNHLHGTDQDSVNHFLFALHLWAGEERNKSDQENRQLPYFLAGAYGDALQHQEYTQLDILVATNRMRDRKFDPTFSPRFKERLSERFEISDPEQRFTEDYSDTLPDLDSHFLRSLHSIDLKSPDEGTNIHLLVAGLESTMLLDRRIIPKHAVIYQNGNTQGYNSI